MFRFVYIISFFINIVNSYHIPILRRELITKSILYPQLSLYKNNEDDSEFNKLHKKSNNFYLIGELNDKSCAKLTHSLLHFNDYVVSNNINNTNINLHIQSPGGSLLPTLAVVDEIKNFKIPVHTYIKGYAASAATLLSVVGQKRYMTKHSVMMIHSVKLFNQSPGNYLEVKDLNDNVELFMDIIKDIYLENSNLSKDQLDEILLHDSWMSSNKAKEYGLIDIIN